MMTAAILYAHVSSKEQEEHCFSILTLLDRAFKGELWPSNKEREPHHG